VVHISKVFGKHGKNQALKNKFVQSLDQGWPDFFARGPNLIIILHSFLILIEKKYVQFMSLWAYIVCSSE